jgi:hypothetical protein
MLTNAGKDAAIAGVTTLVTHVALLTAITDWKAGTFTEATYTGYARTAISWGAAAATSDGAGRQQANSGTITFPQNTGANQDIIGYSLQTASSGGTNEGISLLDTDSPIIGTVDLTSDLVTAPAHGLSTDQRVFFLKAVVGTVPDAFAENVAYFVLASGLTADAFKLSTSSGGAAVNPTVSGAAQFIPYTAQTIATNASPTIASGAIKVQL